MINETQQIFTTIVTIIGSIGLGAIISAWINICSQKKKLLFEVKLKTYSDLIRAYQDGVIDGSDAGKQRFIAYQKQMELIANDEIILLVDKFLNSTDGEERIKIGSKFIAAMSKDLREYY